MNNEKYTYVNKMNILFGDLELVDIQSVVDNCKDRWFNQTLCKVNDSVVRLGIVQGEYHWHKHDSEDEFFLVLKGELYIDLEDQDTILLKTNQGFVVPAGVKHRTRAAEKTIILMIENIGIIPTGDE